MFTYSNQAEIDAVVKGFELCTTEKTAFKHQDHLTVSVCYLRKTTVDKAIEKMREALLRFVNHHKVDRQKYNETITVFWFQIVAEAMSSMPTGLTELEQCNQIIARFSHAGLVMDYYSRDLLFSERARAEFVDPDLKDWRS